MSAKQLIGVTAFIQVQVSPYQHGDYEEDEVKGTGQMELGVEQLKSPKSRNAKQLTTTGSLKPG